MESELFSTCVEIFQKNNKETEHLYDPIIGAAINLVSITISDITTSVPKLIEVVFLKR